MVDMLQPDAARQEYAAYYNRIRTHLSLGKDAPIIRPVQSVGRIAAIPFLGGLHHHHIRIK